MKTPRTDEAQFGTGRVSVSFARQLETELATMTALADRLAESLERQLGFPNCSRAKVLSNEALTAYENHKQPEQQIKKPCDCIEKCGKFWVQRCDCQNSTSLAEAQSWCDYENHKKGNTP